MGKEKNRCSLLGAVVAPCLLGFQTHVSFLLTTAM
jgi:hypothetical protein